MISCEEDMRSLKVDKITTQLTTMQAKTQILQNGNKT
jgi:hypothetical protein